MKSHRQQLISLLGAASLCPARIIPTCAFQLTPSPQLSSSAPPSPPAAISSSLSTTSIRRSSSSLSSSLDYEGGSRDALDPLSPPAPTTPPMKKKDLRTLQRFLEVECWKLPSIRTLDRTLLAVSDACKQINRIVQRAQTDDLYGAAIDPITGLPADVNVQGEVQQQLDVLCNTLMLRAFCGASNGAVCAVASEEEPLPRSCADVMGYDTTASSSDTMGGAFQSGEYVAVFDPIDGSKNIDSSLPVGTIFGIYRSPDGGIGAGSDGYSMDSFLQRGTNLVAAGYCLYSATTVLVLTLGSGVHGFTLDPDRQAFLQTHPNMRIPDVGSLYSFNEAYSRDYSEPVRKFLENMKETGKMGGKKVSSRYVGALVADVHNILINGGIYAYPATRDAPDGKLRLLYESAPMAMIMEQAGGAGSTGYGRILDVLPPQPGKKNGKGGDEEDENAGRGVHVRVPTFLGSVENVYELDQFHKYYGEDVD
mmetsp:Transcript_21883/g.52913  ORF Transcript_21883/g.52913 Transcript_21883/m.52913 type:complete len:479 (-) Transcript_21883:36-1472(-)